MLMLYAAQLNDNPEIYENSDQEVNAFITE